MKLIKSVVFALFLGLSALAVAATPVDVNKADVATLADGLNGVGPRIAAAIVDYRKQHGPFRKIEDLMNVKGVGPKILERNRGNIVLGGARPRATP